MIGGENTKIPGEYLLPVRDYFTGKFTVVRINIEEFAELLATVQDHARKKKPVTGSADQMQRERFQKDAATRST